VSSDGVEEAPSEEAAMSVKAFVALFNMVLVFIIGTLPRLRLKIREDFLAFQPKF